MISNYSKSPSPSWERSLARAAAMVARNQRTVSPTPSSPRESTAERSARKQKEHEEVRGVIAEICGGTNPFANLATQVPHQHYDDVGHNIVATAAGIIAAGAWRRGETDSNDLAPDSLAAKIVRAGKIRRGEI
jgi:hypothetical protein